MSSRSTSSASDSDSDVGSSSPTMRAASPHVLLPLPVSLLAPHTFDSVELTDWEKSVRWDDPATLKEADGPRTGAFGSMRDAPYHPMSAYKPPPAAAEAKPEKSSKDHAPPTASELAAKFTYL